MLRSHAPNSCCSSTARPGAGAGPALGTAAVEPARRHHIPRQAADDAAFDHGHRLALDRVTRNGAFGQRLGAMAPIQMPECGKQGLRSRSTIRPRGHGIRRMSTASRKAVREMRLRKPRPGHGGLELCARLHLSGGCCTGGKPARLLGQPWPGAARVDDGAAAAAFMRTRNYRGWRARWVLEGW